MALKVSSIRQFEKQSQLLKNTLIHLH